MTGVTASVCIFETDQHALYLVHRVLYLVCRKIKA